MNLDFTIKIPRYGSLHRQEYSDKIRHHILKHLESIGLSEDRCWIAVYGLGCDKEYSFAEICEVRLRFTSKSDLLLFKLSFNQIELEELVWTLRKE
jgi:hypothetical protein